MVAIGKRNTLKILRENHHGFFLDGENHGEILLPGRTLPREALVGDAVEVFLYTDSEDRLIATTAQSMVEAGGFAALEVVSYIPGTGAFLNWGLEKDLFLPLRNRIERIVEGDRVMIHAYLDDRSQRMVATMKLDSFLDRSPPFYDDGQAVSIIIASESPLGFKAIIENAHWGLLYRSDLAGPLTIGERMNAFIRTVRDDDRIDLSLDPAGYSRVKPLAQFIMEQLWANDGYLGHDDTSSPESIRDTFGTSKKAFKQALGALYRDHKIEFLKPGIQLTAPATHRRRP